MRFSNQNLNEDEHYKPKGSAFWHGRAWLSFRRIEWHIEWLFGRRSHLCLMHLDLGYGDNQDGIMLAINLPYLFGFFLGVEGILHSMEHQRQIGWSWFDKGLHVSLWRDPNQWSSSDPRWWKFSIYPFDILFGKIQYSARNLKTERHDVIMPEGVYPCSISIFESIWKRPRWLWPTTMIRSSITPDTPIPYPGKGENSWDCGEDAIYSMTCPVTSGAEAALRLQTSVLKSREKYGGIDWLPTSSQKG